MAESYNLDEIYKRVAKERNVPVAVVKKAYVSYWKAINEHYASIPLQDDNMTEEQLISYKPKIPLKYLGNLSINYIKWQKRRSYIHYLEKSALEGKVNIKYYKRYHKDDYKEDQADVHEDCDNDE